jgi:hypothetical protein
MALNAPSFDGFSMRAESAQLQFDALQFVPLQKADEIEPLHLSLTVPLLFRYSMVAMLFSIDS